VSFDIIDRGKEVLSPQATGYRMLHQLACRFAFSDLSDDVIDRLPHVAPACVPALLRRLFSNDLTGTVWTSVRNRD